MKLFWVNILIKRNSAILNCVFLALLVQSCATNRVQFGAATPQEPAVAATDSIKKTHTFYLIGDAGNADGPQAQNTLGLLEKRLENAGKNSTLVFLGDNIYPMGMPYGQNGPERAAAETKLMNQLKITEHFKGKTIFIPGNHDWYHGIKGLQEQENFVNDYLTEKKAFLPRKSCGIENITINDQLSLIVIDSQWFLEDWDKQPGINDDCDIKTREDFFSAFETIINKNQNKTTLIAMHHPLVSNGPHGGQFSWRKQLYPLSSKIPLPVIGSLVNLLRKTSGISPEDLQNKQYTAFINRIKPIIQNKKNIIVFSGHEHNLQYIEHEGIRQVISGSASKKEAARAIYPDNFSYGGSGYAQLEIKNNGSANVEFFSTENNQEKSLFRQNVLAAATIVTDTVFPVNRNKSVIATVYTEKMTDKSKFYTFLWGQHYRKYYSTPVEAPNVSLDTLHGGLKPTIAGGGHQSLSLRLMDKNGKEYVMRALKKSPSRFLQAVAFKDQNVEKEFKNTVAETFVYDFYTTAHPYTPFVVGDLAEKAGIYHSNPQLFYIPKQNSLGKFNEGFGDELYMVEERPVDSQKEVTSFGDPDKIVGTDDVLANIRKDEKYQIDEEAYIRARVFDMLIGDWDRHSDQWRWAEYKKKDKIVYKPIPRDRDQAFTKTDGNLLRLLMNIPALRHMKSFRKDFPSAKWFNAEPYPQDLAFIKAADKQVWIRQVREVTSALTDTDIDYAFSKLPKEIRDDATSNTLKETLKIRKKGLEKFALAYHDFLQKRILVVGTDKKDKFTITRMPGGKTQIIISRIKKEGEEQQSSLVYDKRATNEIWVYGLDDDDIFEVKGKGSKEITIRLVGGQNRDTYTVENPKRIKIYDYRSKENTFTAGNKAAVFLSDDYQTNEYNYKKPKYNVFFGLPLVGSNPDDGLKIGASLSYMKYGFHNHLYSQKHNLKGNYYFATDGFELFYKAIFHKAVGNWDFEIDAKYTTPNFSMNYFGYGNETRNDDALLGMNYNRVRIQQFTFNPSLRRTGKYGSDVQIQPVFENIEVEKTQDRFVNEPGIVSKEVFDYQQFAGINLKYGFENYDNASNPTMGMTFSVLASWKTNLSQTNRNFSYLEGTYGISHKITSDGKFIFGTLLKGKILLNNNFEFYQGATLGGDYDLRGFRKERFLGKESFFQSSDLRWNIGKIRQNIVPMTYGILGGYDYGRVWLDTEKSNKWHQSFGGGVWLNGLNVVTARITYFNSSDGNRIAFGLGFGF
ncbi:metallophosphoesterase [Flavobacterium humi]|uniref:Metallophosphoesterase n=1 Tax=Flavobacterium humi TaxID=2562683 RepID=A0A4Z0LCD9_9FLAO|nr:metallophosphoesterase [Flavobacterium humi]TGD59525.1 metallophosphoesterase [Flavobacterium humi]